MGWVLPSSLGDVGDGGVGAVGEAEPRGGLVVSVRSCSPPAGAFAPSLLLQLMGGTHV